MLSLQPAATRPAPSTLSVRVVEAATPFIHAGFYLYDGTIETLNNWDKTGWLAAAAGVVAAGGSKLFLKNPRAQKAGYVVGAALAVSKALQINSLFWGVVDEYRNGPGRRAALQTEVAKTTKATTRADNFEVENIMLKASTSSYRRANEALQTENTALRERVPRAQEATPKRKSSFLEESGAQVRHRRRRPQAQTIPAQQSPKP